MHTNFTTTTGYSNHTVVVGTGVAGAAIAHELQKKQQSFTIITSAFEGSSYTNQKWLHSGALYPSARLAQKVWGQFRSARPELRRHVVSKPDSAAFLAIHPHTIAKREEKFQGLEKSGFLWEELSLDEYSSIGSIGRTNANLGRRAKDLVIDFPSLIEELLGSIPPERILMNHDAFRVETDGTPQRVTAIHCHTPEGDRRIQCDRCVLAAGAWTPLLLAQSQIALKQPLVRKKCIVITFDGELVPGITVCYDIKHFNPAKQKLVEADVSLVPYKGKTLAAGTGWVRLNAEQDPRTVEPTFEEVNELLTELYQAFPFLGRLRGTPHSCIKTEPDMGDAPPNVLPQVFDQTDHGTSGLFVALPGKATLMFDLADKVLTRVLNPEQPGLALGG